MGRAQFTAGDTVTLDDVSIDVSGIKDIEGFINNVEATFGYIPGTCISGTVGAKALSGTYKNDLALTNLANDNHSATEFQVTIGGKVFTGTMFHIKATNLNNAKLKMTNADTGEWFTITAGANYGNGDTLNRTLADDLNVAKAALKIIHRIA
jgi:hypothetical protein